jgi:hypothetical protein
LGSARETRVVSRLARRILALLDLIGRGRASGVEIARARARADNPFHICDGRVTRLVLYFDGEHAFADLGLRA